MQQIKFLIIILYLLGFLKLLKIKSMKKRYKTINKRATSKYEILL